jgi:hypothetical protein
MISLYTLIIPLLIMLVFMWAMWMKRDRQALYNTAEWLADFINTLYTPVRLLKNGWLLIKALVLIIYLKLRYWV